MEGELYRDKTIFKTVFRLVQSRSLNGVVDLYGISLTQAQLDMIRDLPKTNERLYHCLVRKVDTRESFIVETEAESNLQIG